MLILIFNLLIVNSLYSKEAPLNGVVSNDYLLAQKASAQGQELILSASDLSDSLAYLHQLNEKARYVLIDEPKAAFLLAKEAEGLAMTLNHKIEKKEAVNTLYLTQKALGNDSLAYVFLEEYSNVKKNIEDSTNLILVEEINRRYEVEQGEKELQLLRTQKEIRDLQVKRNQIIVKFMLPPLLILVMLLVILWLQFQKKRSLQLILEEHHQKTKDLHQELKLLNNELLNAESQQKTVNATKDQFFSVVSQDLKNPLNSLSLFLKNFIEKSESSAENNAQVFIKKISEPVANLSTLINNLLEWSRLQIGNIEFKPEKLDLKPLLEENLALIHPYIRTKNTNIEPNIPEQTFIVADKQMIGFVFRNLISQIVSYGAENSSIAVVVDTVAGKQEFLNVSVKSNDHDFPRDRHLQEREANGKFLKSSEKARNWELGFFLCKEFLEKHNGEIEVERNESGIKAIHFSLPQSLD